MGLNDIHSLSHTKWNCKYHIVFAPKYRRKVFYQEKRAEVGKILRQLCEWKGVRLLEGEVCPDHVHILVEIPPKMSVSGFMGYLKGKSSTMLYEKFGELKYKYRSREFWCRGYYVDKQDSFPALGVGSRLHSHLCQNFCSQRINSQKITSIISPVPYRGLPSSAPFAD